MQTSVTASGTLNELITDIYNDDGDFLLDGLTYAGNTTAYGYDNDGLLTTSGSYTINRNTDNGLPESVTGTGFTLARSFNQYGELDGQDSVVNGSTLYSWSVPTRYENGLIQTKTETVNGVSTTYTYTYDSMNRLESVEKDGVLVEEYAYDSIPFGTRTSQTNTLRGITRTLSYDTEDHLLSTGSATYSYDLDGFLTSKTEGSELTTYDYSLRGELLSVDLPDGDSISYVYDPLGRRIAKKVNGTITEKYLWQNFTRLLARYDGSDNLVMRFEYADDRLPVAMTSP